MKTPGQVKTALLKIGGESCAAEVGYLSRTVLDPKARYESETWQGSLTVWFAVDDMLRVEVDAAASGAILVRRLARELQTALRNRCSKRLEQPVLSPESDPAARIDAFAGARTIELSPPRRLERRP